MRGLYFCLIFVACAAGAWAQAVPVVEENVAPVSVSVPVVAPVSTTVSPFVVKGVVVKLSDTTGFARDAALEQAARMSLPKVLMVLPMDAAKAAATAKSVGDPMKFVSSYKVVQEALVPAYSLTVDLTFNEAMLRSNFGGKKVVPVVVPAGVSATQPLAEPVPEPVGGRVVMVKVRGEASEQDVVYRRLNGLKGTQARYEIVSVEGAVLKVQTGMADSEVAQVLSGLPVELGRVANGAAAGVSGSVAR